MSRGRVTQKHKTRRALLDAGLRLVRRGEDPTLESVAAEAEVSRATAYRYFPRIGALLSALPLVHLVGDDEVILGDAPRDDAAECAVRVQRYFYDFAVNEERAFRRFLMAVLEETLLEEAGEDFEPLRGAYRLRALDAALASLEGKIAQETMAHLRGALVALSGIESLMVVKDVCGLDVDSGRESLEWAARALIDAARREGAGPEDDEPAR